MIFDEKTILNYILGIFFLTFSIGIINVGMIPFKLILMLLFSALVLHKIAKDGCVYVKYTKQLYVMIVALNIWSLLGIVNGFYETVWSECISLIATLSMCVLVYISNSHCLLDKLLLKKYIKLTLWIGVGAKFIFVISIVFWGIDSVLLMNIFREYLGLANFDIGDTVGFMGSIPRIGGAMDVVFLIIYSFYIAKEQNIFLHIIMLLFSIITYSRVIMGCYAILTIYYIVMLFINKRINNIIINISIVAIIVFLLCTSNIIDDVYLGFFDRYTGELQEISDSWRTIQFNYMLNEIYQNPWFGLGIGGYSNDYVLYRSGMITSNSWRTELEYVFLFMQFGIFGFLLFVVNFIFYACRYIFENIKGAVPVYFGILVLVLSPLESMIITLNVSAFIFSIVLIMGKIKEK